MVVFCVAGWHVGVNSFFAIYTRRGTFVKLTFLSLL